MVVKNNGLSVKVNIFDKDIWISNVHFNSDITGYQQVYQSKELENYIINIDESHIFLGDFNSPNSYKSTKYLKQKGVLMEIIIHIHLYIRWLN